MAFISSEATNQLDPQYPHSGKVDRKEYADMRKLLEAATGGRYRWSTATEERARQNRMLQSNPAGQPTGSGGHVCSPAHTTTGTARSRSRNADCARSVFDQPIDFASTNVNICFMQQDTVFRDWWVAAEHRRKLGFVGRVDSLVP